MAKKKASKWLVRVRDNADGHFCQVWLVRRDGPADAALMWGELLPAVAEEVVTLLGLPVERERSLLVGVEPLVPPGCVPIAKQLTLFPDAAP